MSEEKEAKISLKSIFINFVAVTTCIAGFIFENNGLQNFHILISIFLSIACICGAMAMCVDELRESIIKQMSKKYKEKIEYFKKDNPVYLLYQISFATQLAFCCYFGAWVRVIFLVLSILCLYSLYTNVIIFLNKEKEVQEKSTFDGSTFDKAKFN